MLSSDKFTKGVRLLVALLWLKKNASFVSNAVPVYSDASGVCDFCSIFCRRKNSGLEQPLALFEQLPTPVSTSLEN